MKISVIVDKREKESLVAHELINLGVDIKFERLPVADYIIGNIAVERKSASDFVSSIVNKRLFRQLEELKQFDKALLVVEGDLYENGFNPNATKGMLLSIMLDYNIPVVFTADYDETAAFLLVLAKRLTKGKTEIGFKVKKKVYSLAEQQQLIIEGLPSVGSKLSKALLQHFGNVKNIVNASEEELRAVEKIGKMKARIIKNVLEETYRPRKIFLSGDQVKSKETTSS